MCIRDSYTGVYGADSERQLIERFCREVRLVGLLKVLRQGFTCLLYTSQGLLIQGVHIGLLQLLLGMGRLAVGLQLVAAVAFPCKPCLLYTSRCV